MRSLYSIKLAFARRNPLRKIGFKHCGKHSCIYKPLFVNGKKDISMGNHVSFLSGARIECIRNYAGGVLNPSIVIGDNTSFQQNAHIISTDKLVIGSNCVFSAYVYISTCDHGYGEINKNILEQPLVNQEVVIGDYSFIGIGVKILPGVHIGKNVIIGAGSVVTRDISDYSVAVGSPAKVIKKYDFSAKKWTNVD